MPLDHCLILRVLLLQGENDIALLLHNAESLLRNLVRICETLVPLIDSFCLTYNRSFFFFNQLFICRNPNIPLIYHLCLIGNSKIFFGN